MNKTHGFNSFVFLLAAIWVLVVFADAQAQEKGQEKDKNEKNKKKNEQVVDKEQGGKDKSSSAHGEQSATAKTVKYKPRGMTDADFAEWTDGNPPGWSRGEKTGWGGAGAPPGQTKDHGEQGREGEQGIVPFYPRGSEGWDTRKKEEWWGQLEQSRDRVLQRVRARDGMSPDDEKSATFAIEGAAREGVPLVHIETTMNRAIARGMPGRDIEKVTRAMSYGVDKGTDYNKLDQFIEKRMSGNETGDDIALSIYKEIDDQHAAKSVEPAKKSWWKRLFGG